jgi:hypothetical protein
MFVFLVSHKNFLNKNCSSFEDVSAYNIPWSHVDWYQFCIHLRSLNFSHFGMVKAMRIRNMDSRSPSVA